MKKITFYYTFCNILIVILLVSCNGRILPKKSFVFDKQFDSLFRAISKSDTMYFENRYNGIDTFVLTKIDSITRDRVDCFMCPRSAKSIFRNYRQHTNTFQFETKIDSSLTFKEEDALVTISIFPDSNLNTAYISFKNFRCDITKSLGSTCKDTLIINNQKITSFYVFSSTAPTLITENSDIISLMVSLNQGIIAYKEKSGILRRRLFN